MRQTTLYQSQSPRTASLYNSSRSFTDCSQVSLSALSLVSLSLSLSGSALSLSPLLLYTIAARLDYRFRSYTIVLFGPANSHYSSLLLHWYFRATPQPYCLYSRLAWMWMWVTRIVQNVSTIEHIWFSWFFSYLLTLLPLVIYSRGDLIFKFPTPFVIPY